MCEKASGRSRGFGFITFETDAGMDAALAFKVRNIVVTDFMSFCLYVSLFYLPLAFKVNYVIDTDMVVFFCLSLCLSV